MKNSYVNLLTPWMYLCMPLVAASMMPIVVTSMVVFAMPRYPSVRK